MKHFRRWTVAMPCLLASMAFTGCWSGGPSRVKPPDIDAGDAGAEAVELYDKDGDGFIAGAELDAVPGIKAAMKTIDADGDDKVTADEIAKRVKAWQATGIGVTAVSCTVLLDEAPLAGAEITFEPESFLGSDIQKAVGETSVSGSTIVSVPKESRPTSDTPAGLQLGLYRVRISKKAGGTETIPTKYNAETTLGQQVAPDDPAMMSQNMIFKLSSK